MTLKKQYPCLFCLSFDGPFTSEEHILPRGLGNTLSILPPGVVCDRCNNSILSDLDTHLSNFEPIKSQRVFYGIPNREDVIPDGRFNNLDISNTDNNHINIKMKSRKASHLQTRADGFTYTTIGRKITNAHMKKLARALYKMGLEMVYGDLGARAAYANRFNEVREIVLGKKDFDGSLAFVKHPAIEQIARTRHHTLIIGGRKVSFFDFYYYGVQILYGMEIRNFDDTSKIPPDMLDIIEIRKGR